MSEEPVRQEEERETERLPPCRRWRRLVEAFVKTAHLLVMPFPLLLVGFVVEVVHDSSNRPDGRQQQTAYLQTQFSTYRSNADRLHH